MSAAALERMTKADLEQMAQDMGIDISGAKNNRERAELIAAAEAEEAGGSVIIISNNPFAERYKPNVRDFDLCCRGRLLIVTPAGGEWAGEKVSREVCLAMNALAADIYAAGA